MGKTALEGCADRKPLSSVEACWGLGAALSSGLLCRRRRLVGLSSRLFPHAASVRRGGDVKGVLRAALLLSR